MNLLLMNMELTLLSKFIKASKRKFLANRHWQFLTDYSGTGLRRFRSIRDQKFEQRTIPFFLKKLTRQKLRSLCNSDNLA